MDFSRDFIALACRKGVLRFGAFVTKAGRNSPYFFNAGLFNDGATLGTLSEFYARTLLDAERHGRVQFDMLFGALTKGKYWIVLLDEENYQYAVVTDNRQFTLFVLSRTPEMDKDLYDGILAELEAKQVDTSRLKVTGMLN